MNTILALTNQGRALNAKIQEGNGTIPLEILEIVSAAGRTEFPELATGLVDPKLSFDIISSKSDLAITSINALLTNAGNPDKGIPPLAEGYPLTQIGIFARDPDLGRILYRISQYENPIPIPAASERGMSYEPTFEITTSNASTVIIEIDPHGLVTRAYFDEQIEQLKQYDELLSQIDYRFVRTNARIDLLEAVLLNDIHANPFIVRFDNLEGVIVTGVWNAAMQRVEC